MKSNEERVYVYYWKTNNELIFVKDRDIESFMFECKKQFNNNEFKSFGTFMINYTDGENENKSIGRLIDLIYNRVNFSRCGVFIPTIEVKQKGTNYSSCSKPYMSTTIPEKAPDSGEPSKTEHIINPPK
jgi:hypothetical protein